MNEKMEMFSALLTNMLTLSAKDPEKYKLAEEKFLAYENAETDSEREVLKAEIYELLSV